MTVNIKLSGSQLNNCIIDLGANSNGVHSFCYNRKEIMKLANKLFKFNSIFDKSLLFGDVLRLIWSNIKRLMNQFRTVAKESTMPKQRITLPGGRFKSQRNDFGIKYKYND